MVFTFTVRLCSLSQTGLYQPGAVGENALVVYQAPARNRLEFLISSASHPNPVGIERNRMKLENSSSSDPE